MSFNDYILATHPNPQRYGKRRRTQLKNLRNNNGVVSNINKPKYPNIKPTNLDIKKKVVSVNKLYPNLKPNKNLEYKGLSDGVYTLYGVKDNIKVIDDRANNDLIVHYYNKKKKQLYPIMKKQKNVLLNFNDWLGV